MRGRWAAGSRAAASVLTHQRPRAIVMAPLTTRIAPIARSRPTADSLPV